MPYTLKFHFIRYKINLDEFTFEGRNKSYGAYVLRKAYDNRITFALTVVCVTAIVCAVASKIYLNSFADESARVVDLSLYDGFDLRLKQNILPELPKGAAEKPKKTKEPDKKPEKPKDTPVEKIQKTNKLDFNKITNTKVEPIKIDTLAKNGLSKADSIAAAVAASLAETKTKDSLAGLNGTNKNSMMLNNRLGGLEEFIAWVQQNFEYPKTNRLQYDCTINVYFCINADGTLSDIKILKEVTNKEYNAEVLRVVKTSPIWKVNTGGTNTPCIPKQAPIKIHANPIGKTN